MRKRTGVFGGSFDPVHSGHVQLARSFLKSGLIHQLLILLTPDPPHKEKEAQTPYKNRLDMLKIAFSEMEQTIVSDLERELPAPSYTLQTIRHLQTQEPKTLYYLCMGGDSLVDFHRWYKYEEILKAVPLLVAERPGYSITDVDPGILESVVFVDHEPVEESSTEIRNKWISATDSEVNLPQRVAAYIDDHNLYREQEQE